MENEIKNIVKDNVVEILGEYFNKVNNVLDEMPVGNIRKLSKENSPTVIVDKEKMLLCDKINQILALTEWSVKVVEVTAEFPQYIILLLTEITGESYEYVMNLIQDNINKAIEWINNKLQKGINIVSKKLRKCYRKMMILIAKINKCIKIAQRLVYRIMRKILQRLSSGKMVSGTIDFINTIIKQFQALTVILDIAMAYINKIIQLLPIMMQLDGETMGFFITPKSLTTVALIPTNDQISIFSGLANEIFYAINEYISSIKISEKTAKTLKIVEQGALAAANTLIPDAPEFDFNAITPEKLHQKILTLLELFIQSEPMPEYKKLNVINPGFMIWLLNTFEPGMKKTFGLPGFP